METQNNPSSTLLICIFLVLLALLAVQGSSFYSARQERIEVFTVYVKDLESYDTNSVYHQIYHANNAQLKLNNLIVQENELLATLISGKR
jgi:hypothetical protein